MTVRVDWSPWKHWQQKMRTKESDKWKGKNFGKREIPWKSTYDSWISLCVFRERGHFGVCHLGENFVFEIVTTMHMEPRCANAEVSTFELKFWCLKKGTHYVDLSERFEMSLAKIGVDAAENEPSKIWMCPPPSPTGLKKKRERATLWKSDPCSRFYSTTWGVNGTTQLRGVNVSNGHFYEDGLNAIVRDFRRGNRSVVGGGPWCNFDGYCQSSEVEHR